MTGSEEEFIVIAVAELFEEIKRGEVRFTESVPQTIREVKAVRFDRQGKPIYNTIGPLVRALARMVVGQNREREAERCQQASEVLKLLGQQVSVTDEVLQECTAKSSFSPLAFELYKETVRALAVCSHLYASSSTEEASLPRNQAICAGLLVRIAKFMTAVASLVAEDPDRADVVFALNRSITESATDLRYLLAKNEERAFGQFVKAGLASEREPCDLIQKNIALRGGEALPIERRMLKSIEKVFRLSGVAIEDVPGKMANWAGGLRNRLVAIGEGDAYPMLQRIPSHAVHGTWVDLLQHHLADAGDGGFRPDPTWSRVDSRLMLPVCVLVLVAARTYLQAFFFRRPELKLLLERIEDLMRRIMAVDEAEEASRNRGEDEG